MDKIIPAIHLLKAENLPSKVRVPPSPSFLSLLNNPSIFCLADGET